MDIFKKTALGIFVSASLLACGGGGDDSPSNNTANTGGTTGTTYNIESGAFQKGPFIAGTTVTIQELGEDLKPTGITYTTVTDDAGRFNASNIKSRFVEVFADGFYFDELNNAKSKAPVTLRAILDLTASASKPSINTLTTMQTERLREVKKSGKTFQQAEADSRNAVLNVFGLSTNSVARLDSINLTGTAAGDESLLRATVALLQVASHQSSSVEAELTTLVAKLGSDLKDDGQANGTAKDFVAGLKSAQTQVDTEYVRSLVQDYLGTKGQPEPQVIGESPSPKLSQWISVGRERVNSESLEPSVIWLLRDDGSIWSWPLQQGKNLEQATIFKDIVSFYVIPNTHRLVALDKAGNAYQFDTKANQLSLIDVGVKQISPFIYLKQNGYVMNWDKKTIPNIPLMSRLVGANKSRLSNVTGGLGKDTELYYFKYSDAEHTLLTDVNKLGKYGSVQVLLTDKTSYDVNISNIEYPAAILNGKVWSFIDNSGRNTGQQILSTIYTHIGGMGLGQWSPALADDGYLWYWSNSANSFVKSNCGGVKKTIRSEVVLMNDHSIRPIIFENSNGVGNVSCPVTTIFNHLSTVEIQDMYSLTGGIVLAITTDKQLIARTYTFVSQNWKPADTVYTTSFSQ